MLTISRIDHICQVVPDAAPQVDRLERLFGFHRARSGEDAARGSRSVVLEVPGGALQWEVQTPLGPDSPLQAFLDGPRGPGLHHVAVEVPDLAAATGELSRLGASAAAEHGNGAGRWADATALPAEGPAGLLFRFFPPGGGSACGGERAAGVAAGAGASEAGPGLGIVAVDHVCQAYRDRDELARWYERVFGMREVYRTPDGEHDDLADLVMDVPGASLRWEIIQPVGEESFIRRFLETRGAAAHHVTFEVADWEQALEACRHHEVATFGANEGETDGARWRDAFIHPKQTGGVLVQIFWEERPGVWVRSDKIPSGR